MNNQGALPPELASILSTLSQFIPPVQSPRSHDTSSLPPFVDDTVRHPLHTVPPLHSSSTLHVDSSTAIPTQTGLIIDPATITEWSAGLRCISKLAAQSTTFGNSIRQMIGNQRRNEVDWYTKRQELKREQASSHTASNELSSILKSLGGSSATTIKTPRSEEDLIAELEAFDLKIYKAQTQMYNAMSAEMKALGVPFFGTRPDLITPSGQPLLDSGAATIPPQKWSPPISASELRTLQRRMVTYLEDMYKD